MYLKAPSCQRNIWTARIISKQALLLILVRCAQRSNNTLAVPWAIRSIWHHCQNWRSEGLVPWSRTNNAESCNTQCGADSQLRPHQVHAPEVWGHAWRYCMPLGVVNDSGAGDCHRHVTHRPHKNQVSSALSLFSKLNQLFRRFENPAVGVTWFCSSVQNKQKKFVDIYCVVKCLGSRIMQQAVLVGGGDGVLYSSTLDCFWKTLRSEGPLGLYKGFIPVWMRIGPHTIITFFFYEQFRKALGIRPVWAVTRLHRLPCKVEWAYTFCKLELIVRDMCWVNVEAHNLNCRTLKETNRSYWIGGYSN